MPARSVPANVLLPPAPRPLTRHASPRQPASSVRPLFAAACGDARPFRVRWHATRHRTSPRHPCASCSRASLAGRCRACPSC